MKIRQCLSDVVYWSFQRGLFVIFHLFFRVRVTGLEHCPRAGPLLVVSNHLSEWDPPFVGTFLPWQVHWLAKVELFQLLDGWMNGFFRMLHCVPVDRSKADFAAIKSVVRLLKDKRPVLVFAEGGVRTDHGSLLGSAPELKEGAASMAIMSQAPILPILLNGTIAAYHLKHWHLFRKRPLEIVIGPVFQIEGRERDEVTRQIQARMLELKSKLEQQTPQ